MSSNSDKKTTYTPFGIINNIMEGIAPATVTQCPEAILASQTMGIKGPLSAELKFDIVEGLDNSIGNVKAQDKVFEIIAGTFWKPAIVEGKYLLAESIWNDIFQIVYEWEHTHPGQRVHKGTGYYFWAVTCIQAGVLEKGFLLMHQALEEDMISYGIPNPPTPAYALVTLDHEKKDQYFRDKVEQTAQFVEEKLRIYLSTRSKLLSFPDFRAKFLNETTLQEEVFSFVYEAFHLRVLLKEISPNLTKNTYSSLLQAKTLLNLCLVIDNVIKQKNPNQKQFSDHIIFLSNQANLNLNDNRVKQKLNGSFRDDFPDTVQKIISSQYLFQDRSSLTPMEEDLALSYGFRNFGAHRLEDQPVIYENFAELVQRILNVLFSSVELLY